jgi:hypothetical protein
MLTVEPDWLVSLMPVRVSDRDRIWLLELLLVFCASDRRLAVADPLVFVVPVKNNGTLWDCPVAGLEEDVVELPHPARIIGSTNENAINTAVRDRCLCASRFI